jgi:peptidoglycan/xylan/chitin deacetylase (PgdA/CDA1 family)
VDFGAHSHSHAILSLLDPEAHTEEITGSVRRLSDICGRSCSLFAYPNGRREDYDLHSIASLLELGIEAAFTTLHGSNDETTHRMELRRVGVGSETSLDEFKSTLHGLGCL